MTKSRDLANAATALNAVTATELGFVDGVTSAIQTQLDAKLASSTAATTYVANALADAKGDIFVASADNTVTRLPVGSTGDTIVANSSTSTGLAWAGNYAAGKNKIINGDFGIWQRGTTLNLPSGVGSYLADRFNIRVDSPAGTPVYSRQTFTPGTAPVAGYEGQYFARFTTGGNVSCSVFNQPIEDVRTFAGQTVTVSFWMKTSTAKTFTMLLRQDFGSGGSAIVDLTASYTTTTSWARYTQTFSVASIAGKTIGTNSSVLFQTIAYGSQTGNFDVDIWGVQIEAGSVATAFQTATGTIQGELAACQRYYYRTNVTGAGGAAYQSVAFSNSTTQAFLLVNNPVPLRVPAATIDFSLLCLTDPGVADYAITALTLEAARCTGVVTSLRATVASGLTATRVYYSATTSASGYIGLGAEL